MHIPRGTGNLNELHRRPDHRVCNARQSANIVVSPSRNGLLKMGMTETLDMFQREWYRMSGEGKLSEVDMGTVPDIYLRNQQLGDELRHGLGVAILRRAHQGRPSVALGVCVRALGEEHRHRLGVAILRRERQSLRT